MTKADQTIIEEGITYLYGTIRPGALELPEGEVPVCWQAQRDIDHILGKAQNFRREDNRIVCEVEIYDEDKVIEDPHDNPPTIVQSPNRIVTEGLFADNQMMYAGAFVSGVKYNNPSKPKEIIAGKIQSVDIFLIDSFPAEHLPDYIKKGS
jgi:hypothetical protein